MTKARWSLLLVGIVVLAALLAGSRFSAVPWSAPFTAAQRTKLQAPPQHPPDAILIGANANTPLQEIQKGALVGAVWLTAGIPTYDVAHDVDVEAIAAANPDLIVTTPRFIDNWCETLSAIAPTVVLDWAVPWRDNLRLVGQATGRADHTEAEIARADDLVTQAKADLAPAADLPLMVDFMYTTE